MAALDFTETIIGASWRGLRADFRTGRVSWTTRLGLSLAAAALAVGLFMLTLGFIELSGVHMDDEHALAGAAWFGVLWVIAIGSLWWSVDRFRRVAQVIITLVGVWAAAIGACAMIEAMVGDGAEFFFGAVIFFAIALSIIITATIGYRGATGRPLRDTVSGDIWIQCPQCGYSMVGLTSCQCPECGGGYTIDELILLQNYAAVNRRADSDRDGERKSPAGSALAVDESVKPAAVNG